MAVAANRTETRMQRRLLRKYIDAEPVDVELLRPVLVETTAGGLRKDPPVRLPPQRVRLVPFKRRLVRITRDTPDGDIINLEYVLIGPHDLDVKVGDHFHADGGKYDVISIEPNRSFRTAVNITYRGPSDGS